MTSALWQSDPGDLAKAQEAAGTNIAKVFFKMQEASSRA
jgi:hypothetical protein